MPATPRIAWACAAVSAVLAVVDTVLVAVSTSLWSSHAFGIHGWPLVDIASLGSAVLGAVIVTANPRQIIGWLLTLIGTATSASLAAESYAVWVLDHGGPGSVHRGEVAGSLASVLGGPLALAGITVVFLLVPGGQLLSRGWRWVGIGGGVGYAMFLTAVLMIGPHGVARHGEGPSSGPVPDVLFGGSIILIALMLLASVWCMTIRLWRSEGETRRQLVWVATGAASVGLALVVLIVGQSLAGGDQRWWSSIPLFAAYAFLVVCIAVAVLRYRLYDVDVIISRAVVLAIATAFVAAGYVGVVVTLGHKAESRTGADFVLSLLVTALVALAFQPLRRRVLRLADRLAYGPRAAPYDALAGFSRRIGHSPAPGTLLPSIAAASAEVVQARLAEVRVEVEGASRSAVWPPERAEAVPAEWDEVVPVSDHLGRLGAIHLLLPAGRDVRPHERRLLADIADQAALALRNVRLQVELSARVDRLDEQARELAASRNRVIGAADAERRRVESAIARQVLPILTGLRADLLTALDGQQVGRADLVEEATRALESLRDLTRGIFPTLLTRSGLGAALTSYVDRLGRPELLTLDPAITHHRYPPRVETSVYFCCVEALGRGGENLEVRLLEDGDSLRVLIHGADLDRMDASAVVDRVRACGGTLDVVRQHGRASLQACIPVGTAVARAAVPGPA